ncbi:hypothetical protein [Pseudomonas sp. MPC6]|uniref:hypothetical protein n=1 Tax=unclassified Pseudomonas TaxID=196821 RepID=UPI001110100B|nr:hypothetical protein [Pseudomonas sp. MPC6]QCY09575.1 hypothetical protein ELQ88_01765 [Pseudomonas sp. MPC6]
MSYAYEGLARVGVLALYLGQSPNELTTLELKVRVLDAGPRRFRLEFDRYLQGPQEANALRVVLPGGLLLQGTIVDGRNEPAGGWLLIDGEPHESALEPPANPNGWKWA